MSKNVLSFFQKQTFPYTGQAKGCAGVAKWEKLGKNIANPMTKYISLS